MVTIIDGSLMEGGGQILRMAVSLSALTNTPIKVIKIRAGRLKGGLAAQHLKGIELVKDLCQGRLVGGSIGSTEIEFYPTGRLVGGSYSIDIVTAGSIALILQAALPVSIFCQSPVTFDLRGGTNVDHSPPIDYTNEIFRLNLQKFNADFDLKIMRRGYFPKGGGHCVFQMNPVSQLKPVDATDFGKLKSFFGWSYTAGHVRQEFSHEMSRGAKDIVHPICRKESVNCAIEDYKEKPSMARDNSYGITFGCNSNTGCVLGASALSKRNQGSTVEMGQNVGKEIVDYLDNGACVDQYCQDQMIIYMALASGKSRIRTSTPLTLHTETAIYIAELLTKAKFNVIKEDTNCIIECEGIALKNAYNA